MSKHLTYSSSTYRQLGFLGGLVCFCLLLSGCPSASNPTQSQTPATPTPPPSTGTSSTSGSSSASSPPSSPGQSTASSTSESTSTEQSADSATSSAAGDSDRSGQPPPGDSPDSGEDQNAGDPGSVEPGFGDGITGDEGLPDLTDEPSLEDVAVTPHDTAGEPGATATGSAPGSGYGGTPPPGGGSQGSGYGGVGERAASSGPLTPAEQVAILDAQLEKGAGQFDTMILETQAEQRQAEREQAAKQSSTASGTQAGGGGSGQGSSPYDGGMADAGGYSAGGGMGGATRGGGVPQNTAKYPAPADIPSGNDDDVVARQLREAAMREADPAVREKLWDEYRKYKGISP